MTRKIRFTCLLLTFTILFSLLGCAQAKTTQNYTGTANDFRGVWVSSVYNLDYPASPTTNVNALKSQADAILDNAVKTGLNSVILQVRPSADALYQSNIYPWSKYLTGTQGKAPADNFDPLTYWVEAAHKRGLELHAWINPYRITKGKEAEYKSLTANHPAVLNPQYVVKHEENYYFDPGLPEVRKLIIDGVMEIVKNYDVDGIHLDDYFYPGKDFNDTATFAKYGSGYAKIADWRVNNVNKLISELDATIHNYDKDLAFGVSPSGIWANKKNNSAGSNTNGSESLYQNYADSLAWIQNGWIDYITPQIYWEIGHSVADYKTLVEWWNNAVKGTDVELYIGLANYKAAEAKPDSVWYGYDEILRQLNLNQNYDNINGHIFFRYESILDVSGMQDNIKTYYDSVNIDGGSDGNGNLPATDIPPEANLTTGMNKTIFAPISAIFGVMEQAMRSLFN